MPDNALEGGAGAASLTPVPAVAPVPSAPSRQAGARAGLALAALGSIAFSGKAIIVKLAYRYGVDAVTLIMYRMLFALPLFVALAWWAGRGKAALTRRDLGVCIGLGFSGYYLASYLDFAGLQYTSAGLERLILYLNPTLVLLLGVVLHGQRPRPAQFAALALSYAGVALVFGHELDFAGRHALLGAGLVFGSALSYAVYLAFSGAEVRRLGALRLTGWASSIACAFCIAQFLLLRPLAAALVAPQVLWLSLLNATLCTVAPVLMVMMAIERVGATITAQTGAIGPVVTILMGVVLLGEPFNGWIAAGTACVIGGVGLLARARR
ncbi:MAG: DMT family transporter [Burkholderiales bacterium]|nr:DMT family transporter [Burkholderiales bacterium]MDE2502082.1 DMT family transporter [Burkholderiales bacterium]